MHRLWTRHTPPAGDPSSALITQVEEITGYADAKWLADVTRTDLLYSERPLTAKPVK